MVVVVGGVWWEALVLVGCRACVWVLVASESAQRASEWEPPACVSEVGPSLEAEALWSLAWLS